VELMTISTRNGQKPGSLMKRLGKPKFGFQYPILRRVLFFLDWIEKILAD